MNKFVWYNPYLPQTLLIAVNILYFRAVFGLIFSLGAINIFSLAVLAAYAAAAFGIANLRWWGIFLGIVSVGFFYVLYIFLNLSDGFSIFEILGGLIRGQRIISTIFDVAIIALMVHPMSWHFAKTNFTKRIP